MQRNEVWALVELPEGSKPIGCKWIFKTKKYSKDRINRCKARFVAKGCIQQEGTNYNETFLPSYINQVVKRLTINILFISDL